MRTYLAVVALAVASPAAAQWTVDRTASPPIAGAGGTAGQITVGVACRGSGHAVVLTLPGSAIFDNGAVEATWDDGSTDRYAFQDRDSTLLGAPGQVHGLVAKLRRRNAVTFRVTQFADVPVSDTVSLSGSSRAIGALSCGSTATATAARSTPRPSRSRPRLVATRSAADWLPRVRGGLDSPMERILSQMPDGIQPDISMMGDRRVFRYRFPDGSRLVLAFRPLGRGQGLVLDFVDVED